MKIRLRPIEIEVRSKDGPYYLVDMGDELGLHYVPGEWAEPVGDTHHDTRRDSVMTVELLPRQVRVEGIAQRVNGTWYQIRHPDGAVSWIPAHWCKAAHNAPDIPLGTLCMFWNQSHEPAHSWNYAIRRLKQVVHNDSEMPYQDHYDVWWSHARPVEPRDLERLRGKWRDR